MAKEYIEREALIHKLKDCIGIYPASIRRAIVEAPAADVVEVKHGEWIDNRCSECGMMPMGDEIFEKLDETPPRFSWFMDYCPNCGAKMDGERKEE